MRSIAPCFLPRFRKPIRVDVILSSAYVDTCDSILVMDRVLFGSSDPAKPGEMSSRTRLSETRSSRKTVNFTGFLGF